MDQHSPNYLVSKDKELSYLINPKAGYSSMSEVMASLQDPSFQAKSNIHSHPTLSQIRKNRLNHKENHYFCFTFVRNPFKRIISLYVNQFENRAKKGSPLFKHMRFYMDKIFSSKQSFKEVCLIATEIPPYLADPHFKPQSHLLDVAPKKPDFIGKLNNIKEDYAYLKNRFNLPSLPHRNESDSYNYMDYYDLETLDLVNSYYQEDLQRFGFTQTYEQIRSYLLKKDKLIKGSPGAL